MVTSIVVIELKSPYSFVMDSNLNVGMSFMLNEN
jgi:hypothetical protein